MSNKTRYDAMMVREYESNGKTKSSWTKIGAAFENKDGSISIALDAIPLDWTRSKIILQLPKTEEEWEALKQGKGGGQRGGGKSRGRSQGETPNYPGSWDEATGEGGGGFADESEGG
jgi:hypothetical protein